MLESSNLTRLRNSIKRIDKYVSLQKLQKLLEEQGETLKGLANASKQQVADLSVQLAAKDAQLHEAAQQVAASKEELAELTDSRKEELAELMEQVAAKDRQLRELALKTAYDRDVFHNEEILKLQMQLRSEVAKRDELEAKQNNHFREKESAVRDKNEAEKALDEVGLKRMYGVAYRCGKRGRHIGVREEGAG
jgi:septal ring factor EnvC (AmiA/AmiB activator)